VIPSPTDGPIPLREFGPTGLKFTPIGLGTALMEANPASAVESLRRGIEEGANHIDTAEMYAEGAVEEIVGRALHGLREKVFVVSKVQPFNADHRGVIFSCEQSLKRLNVEILDVYLLHWRGKKAPLEETFRAFERLKSDGKIRHWGVSNFGLKDMEEAVQLVGDGVIACNQVVYHLEKRIIEPEILPFCRKHKVPVVAYSPLGEGRIPKSPILDSVAQSHGATPAQVCLAFLTRDPAVFAIPKASDLRHVRENVRSMRLSLAEDEIRRIDATFPIRKKS